MPTPQEFWNTLPHCSGFHGGCDGDLVGEHHIESCPLYGREEMSRFEFAEAYHAHASAEEAAAASTGEKEEAAAYWRDIQWSGVGNEFKGEAGRDEVEGLDDYFENIPAGPKSSAEEAKTASAVVNPYPHNSKERDLFNEGFFAGYLKDSEAEKYRRLVEAAEKFFAIQFPVNCIHDSEPWFCDGCKVVWEHAIGEAKVALRSALAPFKEE